MVERTPGTKVTVALHFQTSREGCPGPKREPSVLTKHGPVPIEETAQTNALQLIVFKTQTSLNKNRRALQEESVGHALLSYSSLPDSFFPVLPSKGWAYIL